MRKFGSRFLPPSNNDKLDLSVTIHCRTIILFGNMNITMKGTYFNRETCLKIRLCLSKGLDAKLIIFIKGK